MNIDIQAIVNEHIKSMDEKGIIKKTIQETVEKAIITGITTALNGYELRNSIENKISNEVSDVVNQIGFTAYNSFIAEKVKAITEGVCNADIASKIQKTFDEMLIVKRESIKLSEIFNKYREWVCQEVDEAEQHNLEHFHVKFEKDEIHEWYRVELAKEKPNDRYSSISHEEIHFTLFKTYKKNGEGKIGCLYIDGYDVTKTLIVNHLSVIEALLINLVYNNTPIEIDIESENDIDNSYDVDL
jgi:hypothetical protein